LAEKVRRLAAVLRRCFGPDLPDLIGLCEVADLGLGHDVLTAISPGRYSAVWQQPPPPADPLEPQTGLLLGYNTDLFEVVHETPAELTVEEDHRYHWFAVLLRLRKAGRAFARFWAVVNHWPADFGRGATRSTWPRMLVSQALGEFYMNTARDVAGGMLLIGDFNCEPFEPPLTGQFALGERIIGVREHNRVLNRRTRRPYFYNPMWRWLGEHTAIEYKTPTAGTRPPGTHTTRDERTRLSACWRCIDQILVSERLLVGGPARLLEDSIVITPDDPVASDHCAVGARFEYTVPVAPAAGQAAASGGP
jgi:hypothetical protein